MVSTWQSAFIIGRAMDSAIARAIVRVRADAALALARDIFIAHGACEQNAAAVAEHLVGNDCLGISSHGLHRVVQYTDDIRSGLLRPAAVPTVRTIAPTRLQVEGGGTFGVVGAMAGVNAAADLVAAVGIAFVTVRDIHHTGRLGAYTEPLARAGNLAVVFSSGPPRKHLVPPFGGLEGRLSTNPMAWAAPTSQQPLGADFSTTSMSEGTIRLRLDAELEIPPDVLCDAEGRMSSNPEDLYTDPPGFLLPLGGEHHGHKGFALGLLADVAATLMSGDECDDTNGRGYNLSILAVRGDPSLAERADGLVRYLRSSAPRDPLHAVRIPGDIKPDSVGDEAEIELGAATWQRVAAEAESCAVALPAVTETRA